VLRHCDVHGWEFVRHIVDPMSRCTPDQERQIIDALIAIGEFGTAQALRTDSTRTIERVLNYSSADAQEVLHDLQARRLIELCITQGGTLGVREPMPTARWRWRSVHHR
jgi:hypothetical protein